MARNLGNAPRGDNISSLTPGERSHLNHIVGPPQNPHIMIHQHDRIAIGNQAVHDSHKTVNIGRMKPYARLIKDIKHTGHFITYRPRKLNTLPLSGRKRTAGTVKREITNA